MAFSRIPSKCLLMLFILVVTGIATVNSSPIVPSASPEPASGDADCTTLVYNMSDCLTYVEKGSNVSTPEKPCCGELAAMLETKAVCLCKLLGKSKDFPVELDVDRALNLGHVCGLQTPSLTLCSGISIGGPASEPTPSQEPSSSSLSDETSAEKNEASSLYFSLIYCIVVSLAATFSF